MAEHAVIVVLIVAALVLGVVLGAFALRRRLLFGGVGGVEMSLRMRAAPGGSGWAMGIGWYHANDLVWYRAYSMSPRPSRRLDRRALVVVDRRRPSAQETTAVPAGAIIVGCDMPSGHQDVAMSEEAMTGFLSWLEAGPPGTTDPGRGPR